MWKEAGAAGIDGGIVLIVIVSVTGVATGVGGEVKDGEGLGDFNMNNMSYVTSLGLRNG
jgi:hypothetical protein